MGKDEEKLRVKELPDDKSKTVALSDVEKDEEKLRAKALPDDKSKTGALSDVEKDEDKEAPDGVDDDCLRGCFYKVLKMVGVDGEDRRVARSACENECAQDKVLDKICLRVCIENARKSGEYAESPRDALSSCRGLCDM